jgi:hypothetical protein
MVVLCVGAVGCQKIDEQVMFKASLDFTEMKDVSAVPLEFGELVSVTELVGKPHQAVLWFRAEDQSVVAVRVNFSRGALWDKSLRIPRS